MEIGKSIAKIRKDAGLTQESFAEKYNVTQQTISNWENGRSYPDLDTIVQISDDFGVSLDVLMKGDREMVRDFSKRMKNEKIQKIALIVIAALILCAGIVLAVRYASYNSLRDKLVNHFHEGAEANGFVCDENEFDPRYHLEADGVTYEIREAEMREMDSKLDWDLSDKYINAFFDTDKEVKVYASDGSHETYSYNLELSFTKYNGSGWECTVLAFTDGSKEQLDKGDIDFYEGKAQYDMTPVMQQIYEDNKEKIDKTIDEMDRMWGDLFYPLED